MHPSHACSSLHFWNHLSWTGLFILPFTTPAFKWQDGSTCQRSNGARLKSFICSRTSPYLLLGNLNVGTLAGIVNAYFRDVAYNSKQTEKIHVFLLCCKNWNGKRAVDSNSSTQDLRCQWLPGIKTHWAHPRNLIVFLLFNIYGLQCALMLMGLLKEPCLASSAESKWWLHVWKVSQCYYGEKIVSPFLWYPKEIKLSWLPR